MKRLLSPLLGLFVFLLVSCPSPTGGNKGGSQSSVPAPQWVSATFVTDNLGNGRIELAWEAVTPQYNLYRRLQNESHWSIVQAGLTAASYGDGAYYASLTDPEHPQAVLYAVEASDGTTASTLAESNPVAPFVLGLSASLMSESGKIAVAWEAHPEAETYHVYRNTTGAVPVGTDRVGSELASTVLRWDDAGTETDGPEVNTPYYYWVTWTKAGVEYGQATDQQALAVGAYGDTTDLFEPNDNWSPTNPDPGFNVLAETTIFSFLASNGRLVQDSDWFLYSGSNPTPASIHLTIPSSSGFANGDLLIQFFQGGTTWPQQGQPITVGSVFDYPLPSQGSGFDAAEPFYIHVFPRSDLASNVIGTYAIRIDDSL